MEASISYTFSPTTVISSSEVNQNFSDLVDYFNDTASPLGLISIWNGAEVDIPDGHQLCNGTNGTSDLRDEFIIGAGNTYAVNASAGSITKNLAHTHYVSGNTGYNALTDGTTDGSKEVQEDNHRHSIGITSGSGGSATQDIMPPYFAKCFIQRV